MSIRRAALEALLDITDRGAYANLRLKEAEQGLSRQDAAFLSALVYHTLDHLLHIDYIFAHYAKGRLKPQVRGILRLGLCQLLFMRVGVHTACDESVKLTKEIGKGALAGYVNGVMRAVARDMEALPPLPEDTRGRLSIQYGWPTFILDEWLSRFGAEEVEALLAHAPPALHLRAQPPFMREELEALLQSKGIAYIPGRYDSECLHLVEGLDVTALPAFQSGHIAVQGEGAMLACRALGPVVGKHVLDACAAPGGKAAYLYALSGGAANITALELHSHRAQLLEKTLQRLQVCAEVRIQDAAEYVEAYESAFDAVLIDAPCSGLGVAKPDLRYGKTDADINALAALQARILDTCARYVRPGGALVYATCTISERENEAQVKRFLSHNPGYALESLRPHLGKIPGEESGMLQLLPHRHGTEGFFIARMRRGS